MPNLLTICRACGHMVRHDGDVPLDHDVDGLEPIGEGYFSGMNAEGVGHLRCRGRSDAIRRKLYPQEDPHA